MILDGEYTVIEGDFGGGGGPAPHKPIEASDTLASKQTLKMLFAVGEGEIESIDEIYVNGTPFSAYDGKSEVRLGAITQGMIPGFEDIETPFAVNTALTSGTYLTRAVSSAAVDAVRITLKLQGLFQILDNGDRVGYTVSFRIETRPAVGSGTWSSVGIITKSDKASSVTAFDTRVNKPLSATGPWEFRVVRLTSQDTSKQSSITLFDSYTEIQDKKISYPGTALVGLIFTNSDQLGGKIPTISFDAKGMKCKVPHGSFYNPATKTYNGVWNGAFDPVYKKTNNPAWVLYFVLTQAINIVVNSKTVIRGLNVPESQVNAFSFYNEGKYFDEFISDGKGGTEPRFTINNQFYVREAAPTFLAYLLTICNANLSNQNGLITLISDRPIAATKIVNNANVIDGDFNYSGTHVDERYTWANVTYNDPDDKSNTTTVSESAGQTLIDRYGFNVADLVLVGCTSAGQARRKAKWLLEAPTQIAAWQVGIGGAYYNIGEVVELMDKRYANVDQAGLIASATTSTVGLDRSLTLAAGTYTLVCYGDDGITIQERIINQSNGTFTAVTCATPLPSAPIVNSPYLIKGAIIPRQFKIGTVERDGDAYKITATQYDVNKFARVEGGIVVTPGTGVFTNVDEFLTPPVENISFEELFFNDGNIASGKLLVRWDWDVAHTKKYVPTYDVIWRRDNLPFHSLPSRQIKEAEILDTTPGVYEVVIYAVNIRGIRSIGVSSVYNYRITAATSSLIAPIDFWVKGTASTDFATRNLIVTWNYPQSNDLKTDVLKDYIVEVWTPDGTVKKNTYLVNPNITRGGEFNYTYEYNTADFGYAKRSLQLKVYSRDIIGDVSIPVAKTFTNPPPLAPSYTVFSGVGIAYLNITPPSDPDVSGYIIYRDTAAGFTAGPANLVYDGPDTYNSIGGNNGVTYYYRVAAYDTFDKNGLNLSSEQSSTTLSFDADTWTKTGIAFTANSPAANQVSWTSGSVLRNASSNFAIVAGSAAWTSGVLYVYFNPNISATQLQTTTTLAIAVAASNYPLATYEGGTNLKGGDGSAFISGSQIIAGSVGASQIVAGQAVITGSAQIANGILTNAHISNVVIDYGMISDTLQSTNWSTINHAGWRLNKSGGITTHDLTVLDANGDVVLASGSKVDFSNLLNKPLSVGDINTQEGLLLSSISSDFSESFDGVNSLAYWQNIAGSAEVSIISSSLSTFGGKVMQIGNNAGNDQARLLHRRLIPFDSTRQYRIRSRIRRVLGSGICSVGFAGIAADGVTYVNIGGSNDSTVQHFHVMQNANPSSTFTEYVGYTTGFGTPDGGGVPGSIGAPAKMHANVRYIKPMIVVNDGGVSGQYEVDSFIVESLPSSTSGSVTWASLPDKPTSLAGINSGEALLLQSVGHDFSESFDGGAQSVDAWQNYAGSGEISVISSALSTFGGKVLLVGNNAGNDQARLIHKRLLPFDQTRQYRIRCRIRRVLGAGTCSVGFAAIAADGSTFVNIAGSNDSTVQHFHVLQNANPSSTFTEYFGYTTGVGASSGDGSPGSISTPSKMHPLTRYLRPMIVVNDGGVAGQYEIDSFIVESLPGQVGGSGATWASLPDKPTSLSGINSGEGTKLSGIQPGATVGASLGVFTPIAVTWTGNVPVVNGVMTKTSGTAGQWDAHAYSTQSLTGLAILRFTATQTDKHRIIGLNADPQTDASYTSLDYAIYLNAVSQIYISESGVVIGSLGSYLSGDEFEITYANAEITYRVNGSLLRRIATTAGRTFFVDSSFFDIGGSVSGVQFGNLQGANVLGMLTDANASTFLQNAIIRRTHIGLGEIDTLRVAGQAFSFAISIQSTGFNTAVASGAWALVAQFTAAIEYVSQISPSFACYYTGLSFGATTGRVEIRVRRIFDNAIVYAAIVGRRHISTTAGVSVELGVGVLNSTGSTNLYTDIDSKTRWLDLLIQGSGDTTPRAYAIEIMVSPERSAGDIAFADWTVTAGNSDIIINVLKR